MLDYHFFIHPAGCSSLTKLSSILLCKDCELCESHNVCVRHASYERMPASHITKSEFLVILPDNSYKSWKINQHFILSKLALGADEMLV